MVHFGLWYTVYFGMVMVYTLVLVYSILWYDGYGVVQSRILLRLHPLPSHNYYAPHTHQHCSAQCDYYALQMR